MFYGSYPTISTLSFSSMYSFRNRRLSSSGSFILAIIYGDHATVFGAPLVEGDAADAQLPANAWHRNAALSLLQCSHDLVVGEFALFVWKFFRGNFYFYS